jgi:predicted O-methyltransferase YrrM
VRGNSHTDQTKNEVQDLLPGPQLDLLFIDADHSYHGVKMDFEMYLPMVRANGVIAIHDICPSPDSIDGGVNRFWEEIKHRWAYDEIVEDWDQGVAGIGIVHR